MSVLKVHCRSEIDIDDKFSGMYSFRSKKGNKNWYRFNSHEIDSDFKKFLPTFS